MLEDWGSDFSALRLVPSQGGEPGFLASGSEMRGGSVQSLQGRAQRAGAAEGKGTFPKLPGSAGPSTLRSHSAKEPSTAATRSHLGPASVTPTDFPAFFEMKSSTVCF